MKLQYLGTAAAEGIPALFCECETCVAARAAGGKEFRTRSQALIDGQLLIDFNPDTYCHFLKYDLPMTKLRSILITHAHADHLYAKDFENRLPGYGKIQMKDALTIYGSEAVCNILRPFSDQAIKEASDHSTSPMLLQRVQVGEWFETAEGYRVLPLKAVHDPKSGPVIYLIEKDGHSLLYANDTAYLPDETWEMLAAYGKPIDFVSLDCTMVGLTEIYDCHMNVTECLAVRDRMKEMGVADNHTRFCLNHFSHNAPGVLYRDLSAAMEKEGVLVSYDGMTVEF